MTKRVNKILIACGIAAVLTGVIVLSACLLLIDKGGETQAVSFSDVGRVLDVSSSDGTVSSKIPDLAPDMTAISNEAELDAFMNGTASYGYLVNDIELNRSGTNYGLNIAGFDKGRTLDGNGYKIRIVNNGTGSQDPDPTFGNMSFGADEITRHWYYKDDPGHTNVKAAGGFLGVNWGEIKNVTFDYVIAATTKYRTPTSAATAAHYLGVIVGMNMGYIRNTRVNISGGLFEFYREGGNTRGGDNIMAVMGGLAALNMGEIEGVTVDIAEGVTMNANSKTGDGYPTHAVLGGALGKMLSYSGSEGKSYITKSVLKDLTMLGSGTLTVQSTSSNESSVLNEVGIAVGSNTVMHSQGFKDCGVKCSDGVIDGVLMGSTAVVTGKYSSGQSRYGSRGNHNNDTAQYPAVDCGTAFNVVYAYNYTGRVTNCTYNESTHANHAAQKFSLVGVKNAPEVDTNQFAITVSIDREKNAADDSFNVFVSIEAKSSAPAEYVIYKMDTENIAVANNGGETSKSKKAFGGIDYVNEDGSIPYWDDSAPINRRRTNGHITETRVTGASDTAITRTYIDFGQAVTITAANDLQPTSGADYELDYTGSPVTFNVSKASGQYQYAAGSVLASDAKLTSDGKIITLALREARMPGTYENARIISTINENYGFLDETACLVAPINDIQATVGDGKAMKILPVAMTIDNPNDENAFYSSYTFNLSTPFNASDIAYVMYTANGGLQWNKTTINPSFPIYGLSSTLEGFKVSFTAYTQYTYRVSATETASINVAVTAPTKLRKLLIDVDKPTITYVDANGSAIDKPNYDAMSWSMSAETLRFKAADELSGVKAVTVNGALITPDADGVYSVEVGDTADRSIVITDNVDNALTDTVKLKVDRVTPSIAIREIDALNNTTKSEKQKITFDVTGGASGYTIEMQIRMAGEPNPGPWTAITLDENNQYYLSEAGTCEYTFLAVSGTGKTSQHVTLTLTINKISVTLTNDDVLYDGKLLSDAASKGVSKEYDGTLALEAEDLARFTWNPSSPNYDALKNLQISARYTTANKAPDNPIVITPLDPNGRFLFSGAIEYTKASITAKNLTIQIADESKSYGDLNPAFTYSVLGLITGESFGYDLALMTDAPDNAGAGAYNITTVMSQNEINAHLKTDNSNYTITRIISGKLTINSKKLDGDYRITNSQVGANYTGRPVEVTAEYMFNGEWVPLGVRYLQGGSYIEGAPVNVGTYVAELYITDPNYSFTVNPRHEFSIHKAEVGIYIEEAGVDALEYRVVYNGAAAPLTVVIDNGDPNFTLTYKDANGRVLTEQPINAGSYTLEVRCTPADSNLKETFKSFAFVIDKADFKALGVKFDNVAAQFEAGVSHSIGVTMPDIAYVKDGTNVVLRDISGNTYTGAFSASLAGTYKLTATLTNDNFNTLELTATLTIHKKILDKVVFENTKAVYDGQPHVMNLAGLPADVTVVLSYKGSEQIEIGDTWISAVNAGSYTVTATITGENYETRIIAGNLAIDKAPLSYTFNSASFVYDGISHILRPTVPEGINYELALVRTDEENIGGKVMRDAAGDYFTADRPNKYVVRLFINDSNYQQVSITKTLTIEKLSLEGLITSSNYAASYEPNKVYTFTIKSAIEGVSFVVACDTEGVIGADNTLTSYVLPGAGTYRFTVYASKEFYKDFSTVYTVSIYEADMPISFVGPNVHTYNGEYVTAALNGLPAGADIVWETSEGVILDEVSRSFKVVNAGVYSVTAKVTAPNYKAKAVSHTVTIYNALMPDELKASIGNRSFRYDGTGEVFEVKGAVPGSAITVDVIDSAGHVILPIEGTQQYRIVLPETYTITVKVTAANYQDLTKTVTWTVNNGELNISAESRSYKYDGTGKSVWLDGVPEDASVSFTQNGVELPKTDGRYIFTATEVGDYLIDYRVEKTYYDVFEGRMRLSIGRNDFGSVSIPSKTMRYTGGALEYDIAEFLPAGASAEFTYLDTGVTAAGTRLSVVDVKDNNGLVGAYKVTVTLTKENYATKEISFTIKVERADIAVTAEDKQVTFNNEAHSLVVSAPEGAAVEFSYNGAVSDSFSAVRAGKYYVTVTVKMGGNYNDYSRVVLLDIMKAQLPAFYFTEHEFQWEPEHEDFTVNLVDADGNAIDQSVYTVTWLNKLGNVFNNAGSYRLSATYALKGYENDYETAYAVNSEGAKAIDVVVKAKKITDYIYIDSPSSVFNGQAVTVDIHNVPEGATVTWASPRSYVNAGSYTVKAMVSMPNYETLEVMGFVSISALEVDIQYFIKPSYIAGETPRVVGRYKDINDKEINFTVDTASLKRAEEGEHEITVKRLDNANYKPKEASKTIKIVIGNLTASNNLGAIIGGATGGAVALGGGVAALVVILVKKKSIKL